MYVTKTLISSGLKSRLGVIYLHLGRDSNIKLSIQLPSYIEGHLKRSYGTVAWRQLDYDGPTLSN